MSKGRNIIVFDGACDLCNGAIHFIIKRDIDAFFCFTPWQGEQARVLIKKYGLEGLEQDTIVLIKDEKVYIKASAVLEIAKDIKGPWFLFRLFRFLPDTFLNYCYDLIAKNRYSISKEVDCLGDTGNIGDRFIP